MNSPENILLTCDRFFVELVVTSGADGKLYQRQVVRHPGSVVILPCVDDEQVCLIKNYRAAVGKTLIELPAGTLEPDEDPQAAAFRELTEETGYCAREMRRLHAFYAAPGILDEWMTLFAATDLTAGEPRREAGEQIENLLVSWHEAVEMVRGGEICDAKTIVGLLYWQLFREIL